MINKYFQEFTNNKQIDEAIIKDIKRLFKQNKLSNIEKINTANKFDVFNTLAQIYLKLENHVKTVEKYKNKQDTVYHKELNVLEAFIKHMIATFNFHQTFDKLLQYQNNKEVAPVEQIFVNDVETFEIAEDTEEIEITDDIEIDIKDTETETEENEIDIFTAEDF